MLGRSWWVKRDKIIPVDHHLEYLEAHPEEFGLTTAKLKSIVAQAKAKGKNVKEDIIINYALENGWIRVRHNPQFWSINVRNFRKQRKAILDFCFDMILDRKMSEHDALVIMDFEDGRNYNYTYQQGGVRTFLNECKKKVPVVVRKQEAGKNGAWWFKRKGTAPLDVSTSTHIAALIESPETFGLTTDEIKQAYASSGERMGSEGKAREELLKRIIMRGWIRVRHYTGGRDYWSFTVNNFRTRRSDLVDFCWWAITEGKMSEHDELFISSYQDERNYQYSFVQGGVKTFLNELKKNRMLMNLIDQFKR